MKTITIFTLVCFCLGSCTDKDKLKQELKEELKKELKAEFQTNQSVKKGDGTYFYNEPVSIGGERNMINHSTLKCPAIKGGVQRDYRLTAESRKGNNLFCHECMDDKLIDEFDRQWSYYK